MAEIVPTEEMTRLRRVLDMDYALEFNPTSRYQAAIARWLPGQLPERDMQNIGWGLLLVAVAITPKAERRGPGSSANSGMRSITLNAGQVGKALIDSGLPGQDEKPSPDVGWDLADLRPVMAELAREVYANLPAETEIAQVNRDTLDALLEVFPGMDVFGTGWATLGTAMILAKEVREVYGKITRGHIRRRTREQREQWGNGAMLAAIVLGRMGDFFISQS